MNYIKEVENKLRHFEDLEQSIINMDIRINHLINCPRDITAVNYDIKSPKYNDTMNNFVELRITKDNKMLTEEEVNNIKCILESLEPKHKEVLELWYIQKKSKERIAEILGYSSKQTIYDLKNEAIKLLEDYVEAYNFYFITRVQKNIDAFNEYMHTRNESLKRDRQLAELEGEILLLKGRL